MVQSFRCRPAQAVRRAKSLASRRSGLSEINDEGKFDIWMLEFERQSLTRFTSDGASAIPCGPRMVRTLGWPGAGRTACSGWMPAGAVCVSWFDRQKAAGSVPGRRTCAGLSLWRRIRLRGVISGWSISDSAAACPGPDHSSRYGGRLSPDGRWLAYFSDENRPNHFELYVTAFAPGAPRHRVSSPGAREAVWAKNDSGELFYRDGRQMLSVRVPRDGDSSPGRATVLFEGEYFSTGGAASSTTTCPRTVNDF